MLNRKGIIGLIVAGFAYFLSEYLTWSTLVFTFFCISFWSLNFKLPKFVRIGSVFVIIASYIFIYGKIFDPEVGLNFLTAVVMLKTLESDTERDGYMIFFGIILLIGAGSIFERSLEYSLFLVGSFLLLLNAFHRDREVRWAKKEIILTLFLILPLVGVLFFVVPRIMSPISLFRPQNQKGKIGFSKSVNMDEIESLTPSEEPAFYAVVARTIPRIELYWRGNVLTLTDGWNWIESQPVQGKNLQSEDFDFKGIKQEVFLPRESDYFFMLDWPLAIRTEFQDRRIGETGTLSQSRRDKIKNYTVWSQKTSPSGAPEELKSLTLSGLRPEDKDWIRKKFSAKEVKALLKEISDYFKEGGFSYTLNPGKVSSFSRFLEVKKGFCTHFASATAQILRTKGIPTRLVSGYMGGFYNKFGGYYQITENDAHVWVEISSDGRWLRIDPTEWVTPERVSLGGDTFIKEKLENKNSTLGRLNPFTGLGFLQDLRLEFERLNFTFYRLMEEMNYFSQLTLLRRFGLTKRLTFLIIPFLVLIFSLLYLFLLSYFRRTTDLESLAWTRLRAKLEVPGGKPLLSIEEFQDRVDKLKEDKKERARKILEDLVAHSYREKSIPLKEVLKEIRKI